MSKISRYFCDVCGCELDEERDLIELDMAEYFQLGAVELTRDICDHCLSDLQNDISKLVIERTSMAYGRYGKL